MWNLKIKLILSNSEHYYIDLFEKNSLCLLNYVEIGFIKWSEK